MPTRNKLQVWMDRASAVEKLQLAQKAGTTLATLRQIAGAYRTKGALSVSPGMAGKIEVATTEMAAQNKRLPIVLRIHLCSECAACPLARAFYQR
jgi:hypothetical protein